MGTQTTTAAGMRRFQDELRRVTNGRPRREIADEATTIAARLFGSEAPAIDEAQVRDVDSRLAKPPEDGRILRCVVAAAGMPLAEALELLGYWPDARLQGAQSPARAVEEALRILGYPDAKLLNVSGRRLTIQL